MNKHLLVVFFNIVIFVQVKSTDSLLIKNDTTDLILVTDTAEIPDSIVTDPIKTDSSEYEVKSVLHPASEYTTIITMDNKKYVVNLKEKGDSYIMFSYPLNELDYIMPAEIISKIIYTDGKEKYISGSENGMAGEEKDWERIEHTENPKNVIELFETGDLYVRFDSKKLKYKANVLEKSAIIVMKRKAARQNADIILITDKKLNRAYGELPYIEIWGKGYAYTKPAE